MDLIELAQHCNIPQGEGCYDRVLVDAECTHDGISFSFFVLILIVAVHSIVIQSYNKPVTIRHNDILFKTRIY